MAVPIPNNEPERLSALDRYKILDTPREASYDELSELAAQICDSPIGYIKFVDRTRGWFKSHCGFPPDLTEVPREISVCATTVCQADLLVVPDLASDARFRDLPYVKGEPGFRFYGGMPLINPQGFAVGTICVMDFKPKELSFKQKEALRTLAHQVVAHLELRRSFLDLSRTLADFKRAGEQAEKERAKADALLLNILPGPIAQELKDRGHVEPRYYQTATLLFTDFQGFTRLASDIEPGALIGTLDAHFTAFDEIAERNRLETLKTIGDSYMCVGGAPNINRTHAFDGCLAALHMRLHVARTNRSREMALLPPWEVRIGVHTGPVIAGVVGKRKFSYDVWGDTVNIAARLETASEPGRINISDGTYHRVSHLFDCEPRGTIEVKNRGAVEMYFLNRIKKEFAVDSEGSVPNEKFQAELPRS